MTHTPTRIAHFRALAGITQAKLAADCGVSRATIERIEARAVKPRLRTLYAIARVLEVDPTELVEPDPVEATA